MEYSNDPSQQGDYTQTPVEPTGPTDAQLQAWFQQYYGRPGTDDELAQLRGVPNAESVIFNSPEGIAYLNAQHPEYGGGTAAGTSGGGASGGGGGATTAGSLTAPFPGQFNQPTAPNTFAPPEFHSPTQEDLLKDPGYQFRVGQGAQAVEQSAAGRGVLNTGGTLKDVLNYGQSAASQEFGNMWQRNLDAYHEAYKGASDVYSAKEHQYEFNWDAAYRRWLGEYNIYRNGQNDTFDKQYKVASA